MLWGQVPIILAGIPEQSDLSGYWPHDLSDAAAQTPQGCPTSGEELLPIKKEFIMERNCRVVLVAKLIKRMETSFNKTLGCLEEEDECTDSNLIPNPIPATPLPAQPELVQASEPVPRPEPAKAPDPAPVLRGSWTDWRSSMV